MRNAPAAATQVTPGSGTVNVTLSDGRKLVEPISRVSNRTAETGFASSPLINQPKFPAGLLTQDCTSGTRFGLVNGYVRAVSSGKLAVTVELKSPPGLVQSEPLKNVCSQVASPEVEFAPRPPGSPALDVPSPQFLFTRCSSIVPPNPFDMFMVSVTLLTIALVGMVDT